jgi:protease I
MSTKKVWVPLPDYGFDPTEAAIPWKLLSEAGHQLVFCTPEGKQAVADRLMLRESQCFTTTRPPHY